MNPETRKLIADLDEDRLKKRALDKSDRKSAHRLTRTVEREQHRQQKPGAPLVVGFANGRYQVQSGDSQEECESITNGGIRTGDRVVKKGRLIDQMRHPHQIAPPAPVRIKKAALFYLAHREVGGERIFYVGGSTYAEPVEIWRGIAGEHVSINAVDEKTWIVAIGGVGRVRYFTPTDSSILEVPEMLGAGLSDEQGFYAGHTYWHWRYTKQSPANWLVLNQWDCFAYRDEVLHLLRPRGISLPIRILITELGNAIGIGLYTKNLWPQITVPTSPLTESVTEIIGVEESSDEETQSLSIAPYDFAVDVLRIHASQQISLVQRQRWVSWQWDEANNGFDRTNRITYEIKTPDAAYPIASPIYTSRIAFQTMHDPSIYYPPVEGIAFNPSNYTPASISDSPLMANISNRRPQIEILSDALISGVHGKPAGGVFEFQFRVDLWQRSGSEWGLQELGIVSASTGQYDPTEFILYHASYWQEA